MSYLLRLTGIPPNLLFDRIPVIIFSWSVWRLSLSLRMERNVQGLEDLDERFDSAVKLLVGMGSHEREADQRIARSDAGATRD